ncbi:MAG: hypothetical protein P0Y65_00760 [Candidatus Devosia phytovorans]|uniref:Stability determinant domain-containing protein n=1 Tax=Candidatus Devosia phytovorans TaxID=3121372 RepID=A0AAJ6AZQ2_9HYPH|nr:hypothetical protein [Devosia sp.]WEK04820.1 MAG: hypothetical protein P0Y65_00760 [Devosia sp.]
MTKKLDPIISEFATQEEADSYDRWFHQKVQQALDDPRPGIPHDEVMAQVRAVIDAAVERKKVSGLEEPSAAFDQLDPLVSEFETQEQADSYDRWLMAKVERSLSDPRPSIPHDEAMRRVKEAIKAAARRSE